MKRIVFPLMLVLGALHVLGQANLGGSTLMVVIGAVSFNNSYASSDNNTKFLS